eukprot:Gb_16392 [translate_table: standard]
MWPDSLFTERSMSCTICIPPISGGSGPVNEFSDRSKENCRFRRLATSEGMAPVRLLAKRARSSRSTQWPISEGILPENLFMLKFSSLRFWRLPIL